MFDWVLNTPLLALLQLDMWNAGILKLLAEESIYTPQLTENLLLLVFFFFISNLFNVDK